MSSASTLRICARGRGTHNVPAGNRHTTCESHATGKEAQLGTARESTHPVRAARQAPDVTQRHPLDYSAVVQEQERGHRPHLVPARHVCARHPRTHHHALWLPTLSPTKPAAAPGAAAAAKPRMRPHPTGGRTRCTRRPAGTPRGRGRPRRRGTCPRIASGRPCTRRTSARGIWGHAVQVRLLRSSVAQRRRVGSACRAPTLDVMSRITRLLPAFSTSWSSCSRSSTARGATLEACAVGHHGRPRTHWRSPRHTHAETHLGAPCRCSRASRPAPPCGPRARAAAATGAPGAPAG